MRAHYLAVAANTPSGGSAPAQAMPAGPSQMTNLQRGSPGPERHLVARPDKRSACGDGPGGSGHRGGVAGAVHQQAADRARRPAGEVLAPLGPATCSTADPLTSAGTALPCHGGYVWGFGPGRRRAWRCGVRRGRRVLAGRRFDVHESGVSAGKDPQDLIQFALQRCLLLGLGVLRPTTAS